MYKKTACQQASNLQNKIILSLDKAPDIRLRKCGFTLFEDEVIQKYYPTKGATIIAKTLNKPVAKICKRAHRLGVKRVK